MAKTRRKQAVSRNTTQKEQSARPGALKLSGIGVTQTKQSDSYQLALKFDEDTFCKTVLRDGRRHSEVAARLRKLADKVDALRS